MKRWAVVLTFPLLLATAAPTALVTGAVRDQNGNAIAGATVSAPGVRTATDADGTFALEAAGVRSVTISCTYCRTAVVPVPPDGAVVAIVRRFDALLLPAPTERDLLALPYSHVESSVALRPFTLLNASAGVLPGARVSTYGASPFGGLVIDDGIPQYDIAAGVTTWRAFPGFDVKAADVRDASDAFRYGDMAGGGTFSMNTQLASGASALISGGNAGAFHISQAVSNAAYNGAASSNAQEQRLRVDGSAQTAIGKDALSATALLAQDQLAPEGLGNVNESADGLRLHFQSGGSPSSFADVIVDRSGYDVQTASAARVSGLWSDVTVQAGVTSDTPVELFATMGARTSSGFYDAQSLSVPRVAGNLTQMQAVVGVQRATERYSFQGGLGAFAVAYAGGTLGASQPLYTTILSPSASGSYNFGSHWSAQVSASGAFRLPSLLETYAKPPPSPALPYDRYESIVESIGYTDSARIRASLLAMNEGVSNLDEGAVHSAGVEVAWQIAPVLSLRTWVMHVNDTTHSEYPLVRFARTPVPVTVGSAWLTYDLPSGIRADLIYRRDLIDYRADEHVDGSLSGPLNGALRWFAATERLQNRRYTTAGVRWDVP